uniref:Dehydrodechlorinase n=1 Tax=uncultured soil bacterium TaxID=164851 RepID=A7UAR6_9BACT|nr:dehydrodechlorinase [uncultured soil bacterium]
MSDLDRLASRAAIQDLYSDKLIAVDKRQEGRLASIWWDDAEWTIEGIGTYKGPEGALDLANNVLWPMFHECIHYGTNLRLEFVSADKVNGIGDVLLLGNLVEGNQSILIVCVFTDEYERRDGVWKFSKLNACTNYFTPLAGIHFAPPGIHFAPSGA